MRKLKVVNHILKLAITKRNSRTYTKLFASVRTVSFVNGVMSLTSYLRTRLINGLLSKRVALSQTPGVNSTATSHCFLNRAMASYTSGDTSKLVVEHDPGKNKFFIKLGEAEAKLEYTEEKGKTGAKVLNMWHTEVPPELQGRGIAKILAKEAFEYVVQNKIKMRLSCSYLQKYFNDNPLDKYKAAVV